MSVVDQVRAKMREAMKTKDPSLGILRVVVAEFQKLGDISDEKAVGILKNQVASSRLLSEGKMEDAQKNIIDIDIPADKRAEAAADVAALEVFLPKTLSREDIRKHLQSFSIDAFIPGSSWPEGKAIGHAMKFFKELKLPVDGADVRAVVLELRAG